MKSKGFWERQSLPLHKIASLDLQIKLGPPQLRRTGFLESAAYPAAVFEPKQFLTVLHMTFWQPEPKPIDFLLYPGVARVTTQPAKSWKEIF